MNISRCITGLFVSALVLVQPIERAASAHATERDFLVSGVTQTVDDCSALDDSSTLPSPLEVYESTGQCTSNLIYQDIVCTPLTESSGECYLQSGISVSTSQTINTITLAIDSGSLNQPALLGAGPAAAGLAPAALGAARRTSFDVSIDFLNVVRFLVAESNKWPNDKFKQFRAVGGPALVAHDEAGETRTRERDQWKQWHHACGLDCSGDRSARHG
jgi:hypothetical protein